MSRVYVTFGEETFAKLENRAKDNGNPSISNQVRELTELGLKIEEAAQKNDGEDNYLSKENIIHLLNKVLPWLLETRLLTRYLVENLPESEQQDHNNILTSYREKAENHVKGMIDAGIL